METPVLWGSVHLVFFPSAWMGQLEEWFQSWRPDSVKKLAVGVALSRLGKTTALDIQEVLSGVAESLMYIFLLLILLSFVWWLGVFWTRC